jgi:Domain of unknown function (DUF4258)
VIEWFDWTDHAEARLRQREFDRILVEMAIRLSHDERSRNYGRADWLVRWEGLDGRVFEVAYDHPARQDFARVRIVSVWLVEEGD